MTTSTGVIVEYDKNGIRRTYNKGKNSLWAQSLLVDTIGEGWMEHWDTVLDEVCDNRITNILNSRFVIKIYF